MTTQFDCNNQSDYNQHNQNKNRKERNSDDNYLGPLDNETKGEVILIYA